MSLTQSGTQPDRAGVSAYEVVHASREFRTLQRRFRSFAVPATVFFLCWYLLFVIVAVFMPSFMRIRVIGDINIGLCFGGLQFVSTFAITMAYSRWSRRKLDPLSDRLKRRLEKSRKQ